MTRWQDIASWLGKDRYRDRFWQPEIPPSWSIKPAQSVGRWSADRIVNLIDSIDGNEIRFNNLGYRSDFDYDETLLSHKNILVLGCSDTFGAPLCLQQTWPALLQQSLGQNLTVINLSWPGISADWITRVGSQSLRYLASTVTAVCVLWPQSSYREFVSKHWSSGIHSHFRNLVPFKQYWDFIDWKSNNYNFYKNRHMLLATAKYLGAEFFDLTINRSDPDIPWDIIGSNGSQCLGPLSHQAIADYFLRQIDGRPSYWQQHCSRSL